MDRDTRNYADINAETIDRWVHDGWEWGVPIDHDAYIKAKNGDWHVLLTPVKPVPHTWFPALRNIRLLGLASGGGQQMPLFAARGARCTVLDYADSQLASEKLVAEREGYAIDIVKGDMSKPLPFEDHFFDIIFHPVSNCYVEDVYHVWRECFRVLKKGGVLLAGMDNGLNFLFDGSNTLPLTVMHKLPFNPLKDPRLYEKYAATDGIQFSHSLEEQLGGQLKAGFILADLYEDRDRAGILSQYAPQYIATRAIKP
ncbi:methyltransferase [Spirochaetia bacterium]|nr:methyltransferase [Spirochaetia bacterium]